MERALIVVRHAIAFPEDPAQWPDDSLRPLTPEGERLFREAARGLRLLPPVPGVVLASPFRRAWQTAEILEAEAAWPPPRPAEGLQKGRTPRDATEAIRASGGREAVALVGHEPNLTELISTILVGDASTVRIDLDKGGAAALALEEGELARATLRWLVTQEALRTLGSAGPAP